MHIMNFLWNSDSFAKLLLTLFLLEIVSVRATHGKVGPDKFALVKNPPSPNNYDKMHNLIYSSVLGAIRNAYNNFTDSPRNQRSEISRNETKLGEYFLGYSNNFFGTYTNYIKEKTKDKRFYMPSDSGGQQRSKRSVLHLYNMVRCATGCNPLSYKGYGCYCGFLGSGYAVDPIDRCCQIHDWCYDSSGCQMFSEYFVPYLWKCYNHEPVCAFDHGHFGGPGSCAQKLCECDRQLSQCFKMFRCPSERALCTSSPWRLFQNLLMNNILN